MAMQPTETDQSWSDAGADAAREANRDASAEPGGNRVPVTFTDRQRDVLNAIVDTIVPPGGGFSAPSEVGVVDSFIGRYVAHEDAAVTRFPDAREGEFKAAIDQLAESILTSNGEGRAAVLSQLEVDQPELFGQLRALTYAGYYSRPEVVAELRRALPAAHDYHGPPLPYGYDLTTRDWEELEPTVAGSYTPTESVMPVRTT